MTHTRPEIVNPFKGKFDKHAQFLPDSSNTLVFTEILH